MHVNSMQHACGLHAHFTHSATSQGVTERAACSFYSFSHQPGSHRGSSMLILLIQPPARESQREQHAHFTHSATSQGVTEGAACSFYSFSHNSLSGKSQRKQHAHVNSFNQTAFLVSHRGISVLMLTHSVTSQSGESQRGELVTTHSGESLVNHCKKQHAHVIQSITSLVSHNGNSMLVSTQSKARLVSQREELWSCSLICH